MNRPLLAVLLACLVFSNASPQSLSEEHRKIRNAVDARDHGAAIKQLGELERRDEVAFASNDYDYLLARMAESNGDLAVAMAGYQHVVGRDSVLKPYALAHMARIARSTGNLLLERLFLHQLLVLSPDSLLSPGATDRLARNSFEAGNYIETIRILNGGSSIGSAAGDTAAKGTAAEDMHRESQALLADANLRAGRSATARDIYNNLLNTIRDQAQPDAAAERACLGLDLLDGGSEGFGKRAPEIPEAEHLRRANVYRFNRNFVNAKLHYEAVVADEPMGANSADSLYQIGRLYAQQSEFVEAARWFERVLELFPGHPVARDALLQAASAYSRVGKPKEAIKRYQKFIDYYPSDEKLDRAYLNIIDIQRDQGADNDALKWCTKTQDAFAGKLPAALALFSEARIYIAREDWPSAISDLEKLSRTGDLGGAAVPGGTNAVEVMFLKAFAFEQAKNFPEAIDGYLSIDDGRNSYYGWRASERLRQLSKTDASRAAIAQKLDSLTADLNAKDADTRRKCAQTVLRLADDADVRAKALDVLKAAIRALPKYQAVPVFKGPEPFDADHGRDGPHRSIADRLAFLGLYDEAAPELEAAAANAGKPTDGAAVSLAEAYNRGDRADRTLAFIEPFWRKMPADYPFELVPRDQLELLYPAPFADLVNEFSAQRGLDPRFMLSIMRQESGFDPNARSNAAARGLMQLISTTSNKVAGEIGYNDFREEDLYFPRTAILFGSQYLADIFKIFPNQPEAVAGSYNAGEDNMARWLAGAKSGSPDRYVPEIMYSQSKDYVCRVMANYRMYQFLYDENLRER